MDEAPEEDDERTVMDKCWSETEVEMSYEVVILKMGYFIAVEEQDKLRTGASITLLKGTMTIMENTEHPKDKDHILESLQKHDVISFQIVSIIHVMLLAKPL